MSATVIYAASDGSGTRELFTTRADAQLYIDVHTDYGYVEEWNLYEGTGEPARLGFIGAGARFGPPGSPGTEPMPAEHWKAVFPEVDGPPLEPVTRSESWWDSDGLGFRVFVEGYDPVVMRAAFDEAVAQKIAELKARFGDREVGR